MAILPDNVVTDLVKEAGMRFRLLIARAIAPKTHKVVPADPSARQLDAGFYGDLGSGIDGHHYYLRAGEYWFSDRDAALDFGRALYKAMIKLAD